MLSNNLPNKLTILRILLTPVFVFVVLSDVIDVEYRDCVSGLLFLLVAFTDFLDGFIARRCKMITTFGIHIDPIADKILIMSGMGALVFLQRLNPYIFILLFGRDFIMSGIRSIAAKKGADVSAIILGRVKTVFEVILVTFLLFNCSFPLGKEVSYILITITVTIAMVSCIQFIKIHWTAISTSWNELKRENVSEKGREGAAGDDK
jgi:CDP-diacylglycerol--glycerol-3-phosphate 3-phosphatidyltransferase